MKKWNSPEIEMLAIENTENGFYNIDHESPLNMTSKRSTTKMTINPIVADSVPGPGGHTPAGPSSDAPAAGTDDSVLNQLS